MGILFVCHSTGDTNALLATAQEVCRMNKEERIYFLVIGQAAASRLVAIQREDNADLSIGASVTYLSNLIESPIQSVEDAPLTEEDLKAVKSYLSRIHIESALVGTPSKNNASGAFQIAEILSSYLQKNNTKIFNDYFFQETEHVYWRTLQTSHADWQAKCTWFVPFTKTQQLVNKVRPDLSVEIVGHPAVDAIMEQQQVSKLEMKQTRQQLKITEDDVQFLFISGTKSLDADSELLRALLNTIQTERFDSVRIRLGIHPGLDRPDEYLKGMLSILSEYPQQANQVQLIVTDNLIDLSEIRESVCILRENITGDQAAVAADAVACALPGTLPVQTAISGRPAYYHQPKESYLPEGTIYVGPQNLISFFTRMTAKQPTKPLTEQDLGIPEKKAATIMASRF